MTDWERPPTNDADRMVAMVRAMPAEQLKRELVDESDDLELKRILDATPDRILDVWWRRAKDPS